MARLDFPVLMHHKLYQLMDFTAVLKIMSTHMHVFYELHGLDRRSFLLSQID